MSSIWHVMHAIILASTALGGLKTNASIVIPQSLSETLTRPITIVTASMGTWI